MLWNNTVYIDHFLKALTFCEVIDTIAFTMVSFTLYYKKKHVYNINKLGNMTIPNLNNLLKYPVLYIKSI